MTKLTHTQDSSQPAQKTRRGRNPEATRSEILDAAEQEFAKQGFPAARAEAIAAQTGVTKSMIFYHFNNKEELYEAVLERATAGLIQVSQLKTEDLSPTAALEKVTSELLQRLANNPNLPILLHLEAIQNRGKYYERIGMLKVFNSLISILQRGVASGEFRALEPRQAAVNIVGACAFYFVVHENLKYLWPNRRMLSKKMLDEHAQEAIDFIMVGVKSSLTSEPQTL